MATPNTIMHTGATSSSTDGTLSTCLLYTSDAADD